MLNTNSVTKDLSEMKAAIENLEQVKREDYGELSAEIGEEALSEPYENDKELHSLFAKYKENDGALAIINETLICVCGWSLESLTKRIGL